MTQLWYPQTWNRLNRRRFVKYGAIALGTGLLAACNQPAQTDAADNAGESAVAEGGSADLEAVSFGTNWYAQAEHGGFYQAVATGIYAEYGLDVTIVVGGPQVNGTQLLMGEAVDFFMGYTTAAIKAVEENIPKVTVAAIFQKDPQILIAHPDTGADSLEALKGRPTYVSSASSTTYWPFLAAKYGYTEEQRRPYNFNPGPFLTDQQAVQQGYLSSEPRQIELEGGFAPVVFLLADYGYTAYATTIETRRALVEDNPDLVQRFVDASIAGWYSYFENPEPGNALIKQDNPEMTDEQLAYGFEKMQEYGVVTAGDAEQMGIGAMTDERWRAFFDSMVAAGVFSADTDYTQAYTLDFVNKGADAYAQ
ncbi:MAG: ABC transporter substrate-binding protein [Elainellaceae cyanobacterium]